MPNNILFIFFLLTMHLSFSKVIVITSAYNRPEFIEFQYKTFKKFLKDNYEYIVFSDADNEMYKVAIENECKKFGIRHIPIPQEIHDIIAKHVGFNPYEMGRTIRTIFRQGDVLDYLFHYFYDHDDLLMIIDSDVFMVRPTYMKDILRDAQIASSCFGGALPLRMAVPNPEIAIFDMPKLVHKESMIFKAGFIGTLLLDPFHFLQFYLKSHPEIKVQDIDTQQAFIELYKRSEEELKKRGFLDHEIKFIYHYIKVHADLNLPTNGDYAAFYGTNHNFCNYNHGSNWVGHGQSKIDIKTKLFFDFLNLVLEIPDENFM